MSLYADKTGLSYFLSKLKEKLDKRFLRNPINENLKVNGDLTITGNINTNKNITANSGIFNSDCSINGKLSVNEVQVNDKLLIGEVDPAHPDTSNFLTKDDFEKLQNRIIDPEQNIYVDQKNGNDNNDGKTRNTAVRSLDKAFEIIKKYVDTVTITLITYISETQYNTFNISNSINVDKLNINTLNIYADWSNYRTDKICAKIIVPYGKTGSGIYDYSVSPKQEYFTWGHFFLINPKNVNIRSVTFDFPIDTSDGTKYRNAVIYGLEKNFSLSYLEDNTQNLPTNCNYLNLVGKLSIEKIEFIHGGTITGESLLISGNTSNRYTTDPKTNDTNYITGSNLPSLISKYITNYGLKTNFTGNVLGSTKGLPNNITAIYTQGFD